MVRGHGSDISTSRAEVASLQEAAFRAELLAHTRRLNLIRLWGVFAFFSLFWVLGYGLGLRSWRGNMDLFSPYLLTTCALHFGSRRNDRVLRWAGWAVPLLDTPMVFFLQYATFPTNQNPAAIAGYSVGLFVFLLLLASLSLEHWQIVLTGLTGSVCEIALQALAGVEVGAMVSTAILMALAAAACSFALKRISRLIRGVAASSAARTRAESSFRGLIEAAPDAVAAEIQGRLVYVNPALRKYLGYDAHELLVGKALETLIAPEDWPKVRAALAARATGILEQRWLRKDGSVVSAEVALLEVVLDGAPARVLFARDVSELRAAQGARSRMERLAAIGQLSASIGHDMRNPLAAISGAAQTLKLRVAQPVSPPPSALNKCVDLIMREVAVCSRVLSDLMDFARERPAQRQAVDLSTLVAEAIAVVQRPEQVAVVAELEPGLLPIQVDADRFRRVLTNLIQNAVEAIPANRMGRVQVLAKAEGSWLKLEVVDNGVGIPEETRAHLFEPLFTTKAKGTGLGLVAVSNIIRQHGGKIDVHSAPGQGTRFVLTFPAWDEAAPSNQVAAS